MSFLRYLLHRNARSASMIGFLLTSIVACAPDRPLSPSEKVSGVTAGAVSTSPLAIVGGPDTLRAGVEFELRMTDAAFDAARRRRSSSTVTWETSSAQTAVLTTSTSTPTRARVRFLRAGSAVITARWSGRSGSWQGTLSAPATDTTTIANTPSGTPTGTGFLPLPADNPATLPQATVTLPAQEGANIVRVGAGGNLQAAIDAAAYGDVILLAPGARFAGPIRLRRKSGTGGWITIRTDATPTPAGQRVSLADTARFARIQAPNSGNVQALITEPGASGYWIVNVDIARSPDPTYLNTLMSFGDVGTAQNTLSAVPSRLVLDRVIVRGRPGLAMRRCIALNSASSAIINSAVVECHEKGFDSQAILGWNGPGPYLIRNNLLEGAGENVMFGGADPSISMLSPSDIIIENNHFRKPPEWFTSGAWTVKNLFELKHAKRVLIRGNLFENNWADGQDGFAIVLKSVNGENTAPWTETSDVTFVENIVRNSSGGIVLAARPEPLPAVPMSRLLIARNVLYRIGAASDFPAATAQGILTMGGVARLNIEENTISSTAAVLTVSKQGSTGLVSGIAFRRNVARYGNWGVNSEDGFGAGAFPSSYTNVDFSGNCFFQSPVPSFTPYASAGVLTMATEQQILPGLQSALFSLAANSACASAVPANVALGAPATVLQQRMQTAQAGR